MPSSNSNLAIIAAAGSRKTQYIVEQAVGDPTRRVLVTTYTNENLGQIRRRIAAAAGTGLVPGNITVMGWFSFLMNQCARPYQRTLLDQPNLIRSLNFKGERNKFIPRTKARQYFLDSEFNMYRDGVAHFACEVERLTGGLVTRRLGEMFESVYIDEVQDLVGWDLNFLDHLFDASLSVTIVGDPRQHTFSTNNSGKNKKYQGAGFLDWLTERKSKCDLEPRNESYRCNQAICDFADGLYPDLPATTSCSLDVTGHDGIFEVRRGDVQEYVERYKPMVLRNNKAVDTLGLAAINFGAAKGSTYDRVLIFPTKPMLKYLKTRNPVDAGSKDRLYVALTRARFSVAFVVP
ncbi:AAA family ATPase [Pseudonocardia bannensis]|uniref:AAA family ATPase n=1 Tax=Pseudonocardia bannensis TaxID=630973 RepID=A0A848DP62_9PSEU|nr:AAA family ATPase [Pseudonocardia bannensis]NMH94562.1 AAA family ATPase [Pseudonocardia bannensis]